MTAEINKVEITAIDFDKLQPKDVFEWLELFGFSRYVYPHWIVPAKSKNDQYPEDYVSESPEGLYHATIVPEYFQGKFLWMIDEETYERIKSLFEEKMAKDRKG